MICRLTFTVTDEHNLLCSLTRQHPGTRVVITPLQCSPGERPETAMYTLVGPMALLERFVETHMAKHYGEVKEIARHPSAITIVVPLKLPVVAHGQDPLTIALQLLGPDTIVLPLLVENGRIRCSLLTANVDGQRRLTALVDVVTGVLQPGTFVIEHLGPVGVPQSATLTPPQVQVVEAALALGYYEAPRRCTLDDVAKAIGLSKAAVHKRLQRAEGVLVREGLSRIRSGEPTQIH